MYIHLIFFLAGSDYNVTTTELEFQAMDEVSQTMCAPLLIIDDDIANEADEQFSVILLDVSPAGNIDGEVTCITIIDDDSKLFY